MKRTGILFLLVLTGVGSAAGADRKTVVPLSVLYVGDSKSSRAGDYESFLKKYFRQVRLANREGLPGHSEIGRRGSLGLVPV